MYYERTLTETIKNISGSFPVLLVTGPRQIGKTTLLEKIKEPERKSVSLDNPTVRLAAKRDPELFLQRYSPPVLIDEVQYAPELFPYIKILADSRKKAGDFWLTGSQMFHLMANVTESLAGRVGIVPMLGLSNGEISGTRFGAFEMDIPELTKRLGQARPLGVSEIFERIYKGSLPRLYENEKTDREIYFESYIDTYISRDIKSLDQVADETDFIRFLQIAAARTATNVNYDTLAGEVGVSAPTAKKWLSILVSSGLIILIQPYYNNALKRVIKAPRMYFSDTGLCAHLLGWGNANVLERSSMSGAFFETWIVSEIYKSYLNAGKRPPLFFYRDSNKKEIDLIISHNGVIYPIEIKKSAAPENAVRNFSVLNPAAGTKDKKETPDEGAFKTEVGTGGVICLSSDLIPVDKKNWLVPAWLI